MRRLLRLAMPALFAAVLALAGCADEPTATLQRYPTLTPSPLFGGPPTAAASQPAGGPATMIPTLVEPTITPPGVTLPPALALPDASGVSVACAANTLRLPITRVSGGDPGAVMRLLAADNLLYVLADGGLYRLDQAVADGGSASLHALILPGDNTSGRPVQELIDFDRNPADGSLALLDKAGHVFRYDPASGRLGLAYRASPDRDELDGAAAYQFVALTVDGHGRIILLDSSRSMLWAVQDQATLAPVNASKALDASTDVAAVGDQLYTLQRGGTLRAAEGADLTRLWRDSDPRPLGLSLRVSNHLGIPLILAVDALRREITTYIPGGSIVTRQVFAFPDLGLLRDAVYAAQHLYAIAGSDLLVYPAPQPSATSAACPPYSPTMFDTPQLYGMAVLAALAQARLPLDKASLPDVAHLYPGAARLYRLGVHRGTDFYGFDKGTPVYSIAPGSVVEAIIDYRELSYEEFLRLTREANILGMTPPQNLDRLDGRRVIVDHGGGVRTVYAHLDSIAPGIVPGVRVEAGTLIGAVGVSGTSAESRPGTESPHLHFEIWLGDRWLGQGISIRETAWWLSRVFAGS